MIIGDEGNCFQKPAAFTSSDHANSTKSVYRGGVQENLVMASAARLWAKPAASEEDANFTLSILDMIVVTSHHRNYFQVAGGGVTWGGATSSYAVEYYIQRGHKPIFRVSQRAWLSHL